MAVKLINLPSSEYEHPFDTKALAAVKALPGLETLTRLFLSWGYARWIMVEQQGSYFRVTRESCPELYKLIRDTAKTIDLKEMPKVYTDWRYEIQGFTTGVDSDLLVTLCTGCIDLLTPDQLKFVVGHEMGHIKSGHILYHTMAQLLPAFISMVPMGELAILPMQTAIMYWYRMSEFTADRAGLLACQDKKAALDTLIKMSGLPEKYYDNFDEEAILRQAASFEDMHDGFFNNTVSKLTILTSSHPWTVYRASELIKWVNSGEYDRILEKYAGVPCKHCGAIVAKDAKYCHVHGGDPFN